ncbi:hypothetical protein EYC80_010383 [Monilinia laxa]|uniref:Uncharacterized protein n=1 Tax=Monilinia laxa TaxID=61186 RepID=A0A5N6JRL4_MONLA|nr:hypothetical protein EYC80_010383 [Monilinia laxa]
MCEFREQWNLKPSSDRSEQWMRDQLDILLDDPALSPAGKNCIAAKLWGIFYEMLLVDSVDSNGREKGGARVLDSNQKDGPDIASLAPKSCGLEGGRLEMTGWFDEDQQNCSSQPPLSQQRHPQHKPLRQPQQPQQPQQYQRPRRVGNNRQETFGSGPAVERIEASKGDSRV